MGAGRAHPGHTQAGDSMGAAGSGEPGGEHVSWTFERLQWQESSPGNDVPSGPLSCSLSSCLQVPGVQAGRAIAACPRHTFVRLGAELLAPVAHDHVRLHLAQELSLGQVRASQHCPHRGATGGKATVDACFSGQRLEAGSKAWRCAWAR